MLHCQVLFGPAGYRDYSNRLITTRQSVLVTSVCMLCIFVGRWKDVACSWKDVSGMTRADGQRIIVSGHVSRYVQRSHSPQFTFVSLSSRLPAKALLPMQSCSSVTSKSSMCLSVHARKCSRRTSTNAIHAADRVGIRTQSAQ